MNFSFFTVFLFLSLYSLKVSAGSIEQQFFYDLDKSNLLKPDFSAYDGYQVSFSSHGYANYMGVYGLDKCVASSSPAHVYVDATSNQIMINLTASLYYMTSSSAYVYIPAVGLCVTVPGWNTSTQVRGYSKLIQNGKDLEGHLQYNGPAFDIGSCGNPVFTTIMTDSRKFMKRWLFQQTINLEGVAGNVDIATGGIYLDDSVAGRPDASVFTLPAACASPPPFTFCQITGQYPGFPAYLPFPGPAYDIPAVV
jgi:hypothetical protein